MKLKRTFRKVVVTTALVSLIAAGCGDDDDDDAAETTEAPATTAAAPATTVAPATTAAQDTGEAPATTEAAAETTEAPATTAAPAELEKSELKVGVIPINDILPLPAGISDGTFEAAGLSVTQENAAGGAAIVPGVVSGDFDIGFSNVFSLMKAAEEGLDVKIIAAGPYVGATAEEDFSGLTTLDPEITSLADLEGKTIGVNTLLGIAEITLRETLEKAGVTDVNLIEIPFPEMTAAIESGTVDAAFPVEPFVGQAVRAGATVLAHPFTDAQPEMLIAAWFTSGSFIEENPNTVAAFVSAMNASNLKVQSDRDFANEVLISFTPTPSIEAAAATILPVFKDTVDTDSLVTSAALAKKWGLLEEDLDVDNLLAG